MPTVLLPDTLDLALPDGRGGDADFRRYDAHAASFAGVDHADVLVAWQNTAENLRAAAALPGLRLVQTLAAGPDAVVAAGFAPGVRICSGRSLHDATVTEHGLAVLLHLVRRLDRLAASQVEHRWDEVYRDEQESAALGHRYTLGGSRVIVAGFGSIAARLAPLLRALGADVVGVARTAGDRAGFPVRALEDLHDAATGCDVLVDLLPATPATRGIVDAALLDRLADGAVFVNLGRGATVDEEAVVRALRSGRLRGAALDVFHEEPLPASSPLWDAPGLLVTPHVAGNRPQGAEDLVRRNLAHLVAGTPLENLVERDV